MSKPSRLSPEEFERYRNAIGARESGNDYTAVEKKNGNYLGRYQIGAASLEDQGYIAKGSFAREGTAAVQNPANWTGKNGVNSKQDFLNNPSAQDQAFEGMTAQNEKILERRGVLGANTSAEDTGGYLAAAHLTGPGGAIDLSNGKVNLDGNGTASSQYFGIGKSAVSNTPNTGQEKPNATKPPPGPVTSDDQGPAFTPTDAEKDERVPLPNKVSSGKSYQQENDIPVPVENPLHKFASFNYVWTLATVTLDEFNSDQWKTMPFKQNVILASGGRDFKSRVKGQFGQFEFYIDNVTMSGPIDYSEKSRFTNANLFKFSIFEPYSIGLFPQALLNAALNTKIATLSEVPFILALEFVGWDDDGKPSVVPMSSRRFPIKIGLVKCTANGAGSNYEVTASLYSSYVFSDESNLLVTDISITGSTVKEMLQSGESSLQTVINRRYKEMQRNKQSKIPDEIAIVFPDDAETDVLLERQEEKENNTPAAESYAEGTSPQTIAETVDLNLVQSDDSTNEIGLSQMRVDNKTGGVAESPDESLAYDEISGTPIPKENLPSSKQRVRQFKKDSSITHIIEQVILGSEWGQNFEKRRSSESGYYTWFRIEPQIKLIKGINPVSNRLGRLLIYRVIPFQVHSSRWLPLGVPMQGEDWIRKNVAKRYNYVHTGKNLDILDFDLNFQYSWQPKLYADAGNNSGGNTGKSGDSASTDLNEENSDKEYKAVPKKPSQDNSITAAFTGEESDHDAKSGGGVPQTQEERVARLFMNRILDGNDLQVMKMRIMGDPYYISDSGVGNYWTTSAGGYINPKDGARVTNKQLFVEVIFRIALDYQESPFGIMKFMDDTGIVKSFSGLYKVQLVENIFNGGKFEQTLQMVRVRGQKLDKPAISNNEMESQNEAFTAQPGSRGAVEEQRNGQAAEDNFYDYPGFNSLMGDDTVDDDDLQDTNDEDYTEDYQVEEDVEARWEQDDPDYADEYADYDEIFEESDDEAEGTESTSTSTEIDLEDI